MKPSIGRIVHVHVQPGVWKPAIITDVHSDTCVSVVAFDAFEQSGGGIKVLTSIVEGAEGASELRSWRWPARVD